MWSSLDSGISLYPVPWVRSIVFLAEPLIAPLMSVFGGKISSSRARMSNRSSSIPRPFLRPSKEDAGVSLLLSTSLVLMEGKRKMVWEGICTDLGFLKDMIGTMHMLNYWKYVYANFLSFTSSLCSSLPYLQLWQPSMGLKIFTEGLSNPYKRVIACFSSGKRKPEVNSFWVVQVIYYSVF